MSSIFKNYSHQNKASRIIMVHYSKTVDFITSPMHASKHAGLAQSQRYD